MENNQGGRPRGRFMAEKRDREREKTKAHRMGQAARQSIIVMQRWGRDSVLRRNGVELRTYSG